MRKITQICAIPCGGNADGDSNYRSLYALCNDNTLWRNTPTYGWAQIEDIPQGHNLLRPIEDLGLTARCANCLKVLFVKTIGDLVTKTESDLLKIPNFGATCLREIRKQLDAHNLCLKEESPEKNNE